MYASELYQNKTMETINEKHLEITEKINNEQNQLNSLNSLIIEKQKLINTLIQEKEQLNRILKIKKVMNAYNHLESFDILTDEELQIIFNRRNGIWQWISCTTKIGDPKDVETKKLLETTIRFKRRFQDVVLTDVRLQHTYRDEPPMFIYLYTFKTSDGDLIHYSPNQNK